MSLTASTAFQYHPCLQAPAMLVMGHLIDADMEDELLFQVGPFQPLASQLTPRRRS
jgi:hypothetical protein